MVWVVYVGLVLLFVAGYAARYVHPRHGWLLQLIAVFLPLLTLAVLGVAVMLVVFGKWKFLAVHGVLLLLASARFVPVDRLGRSNRVAADNLMVMTFNAKHYYQAGRDAMSQLLAQERPDIVGLQEAPVVFLTDPPSVGGRRHIFPLLKRYTVPKPTDGESDQALWLHQPIFTHFTPSNLKQIPIGEGLNSTVPATITRGQFQWKGRAFAVYNIHLRSFGTKKEDARQVQHVWAPAYWWSTLQLYRKDYRIRAEEAEDVRRLLDQESLPFIILGDFNSTPHNWEYWHIARGLQDTFSRVGQGWGGTYHSRFPAIRIDYVLASPEWQVVSAHVANARLSDHLPFIARLTFPPQAN